VTSDGSAIGPTLPLAEAAALVRVAQTLEELLGSPDAVELKGIFVSQSRVLEEIAARAFATSGPTEFDWLRRRDAAEFEVNGRLAKITINDIVHSLALRNQWIRTAWALAQLLYDQTFKQAIVAGRRTNLGHSLFGIGQLSSAIGHQSAARHYGALALVGDLMVGTPDFRGGAPHMLANLSDWSEVDALEQKARASIARCPARALLHPEAILAATWFSDAKARHIERLAVPDSQAKPFVERLLDAAEAGGNSSTETGTLFEAAAALLFSSTPGFEAIGPREDDSSQTDTVLLYRSQGYNRALLPEGYALVECKYRDKTLDAPQVREFASKCKTLRVRLGIMVAKTRFTGYGSRPEAMLGAEHARREALHDGVHILGITADDLRGKARELRGLEWLLRRDLELLRFGRKPGSVAAKTAKRHAVKRALPTKRRASRSASKGSK
jgi:hypothetical protein